MSKFAVGEIAIAVKKNNGQRNECEIIVVPGHGMSDFPDESYIINVPENQCEHHASGYHFAGEKYLRKKPQEKERGSWETVSKITEGWNPTKETENV